MAACVHCHRRKGKRDCPALRGTICPTCCGEHRLVEIACPSDCVYLKSNEPYQRRRQIGRAPAAWVQRIVRYERRGDGSLEALHAIHLAACLFSLEHRAFDLGAARDGLEFARRRMSPIETPEPIVPPFGEALVQRLDQLIQARSRVEREGLRQVLEEMLHHLDAAVPAEAFPDYLKFLRALYADQLAEVQGGSSAGGPLIVPG